jgi:hypothetical protein
MRTLPACLLLAALTGCASDPLGAPEAGLVIASTAPTIHPGDSLTVELTNRSSVTLMENLCPFTLQRQLGGTWEAVYSKPGLTEACPTYAQLFPPGRSVQSSLVLPPTLTTGRYRVVFLWIFRDDGGQLPEERRASAPFEVAP